MAYTDEAARRILEALAEGLRRKHRGATVEILPDDDERAEDPEFWEYEPDEESR